MPALLRRAAALAASAACVALALAGAASTVRAQTPATSDSILICSLSDVKGKTGPCGCHVPKGGLARRASFVDSLRSIRRAVWLVDAGGYFPEEPERLEVAPFLMSVMTLMHVDAVGVGDRDLRYGLATLRENAKRTGLPVTCANLVDRASGKPVFAPWLLTQKGDVKVGFFGLIGPKSDLGPGRDSILAQEPQQAAARAIAELRKKGANVVVALSNLGKVDSEDLCTAVPGIDVVVCARNVPEIDQGRMIERTLAVYGGEQGWYVGLTHVGLDRARRVTTLDADMHVLGPDVRDQPEFTKMVTAFEDGLAEKIRKAQASSAAPTATPVKAEGASQH